MCCRQTLTPDFSFKLQNDRLTLSESDGHSCDFNSELALNCFFLLKTGLLSHVCLSYYKGNVIEEKIKGWAMIAGLRHRLVHDYDGTNWNIIVAVVFDELPVFVNQIEKLL
ncbi:HepT-like ribonuclease domain-containing protein [Sarcina sp. DSM 11001]|uniref:HepT-like ribonuclease domain-containing protein n=1 Tax=Sarcina sp. DSM 11001 TaxID=1798184 RepID=UPI000B830827|nr:HepT-like ribonuclease domain-containing protein [Sarcina sp. DSM 11001]